MGLIYASFPSLYYSDNSREGDEEKVTLLTIINTLKQCKTNSMTCLDHLICFCSYNYINWNKKKSKNKHHVYSTYSLLDYPYQNATSISCLETSCSVCRRGNPHIIDFATLLAEKTLTYMM